MAAPVLVQQASLGQRAVLALQTMKTTARARRWPVLRQETAAPMHPVSLEILLTVVHALVQRASLEQRAMLAQQTMKTTAHVLQSPARTPQTAIPIPQASLETLLVGALAHALLVTLVQHVINVQLDTKDTPLV